jgi:hypothetical protein
MIITVENELQQRKVIELDARPSDCLAMATQQGSPIYITRAVWNEVEDMREVLEKMDQSPSPDQVPQDEDGDPTISEDAEESGDAIK